MCKVFDFLLSVSLSFLIRYLIKLLLGPSRVHPAAAELVTPNMIRGFWAMGNGGTFRCTYGADESETAVETECIAARCNKTLVRNNCIVVIIDSKTIYQ